MTNGVCVVFLDNDRQVAITSYQQNILHRSNLSADITTFINWKGASLLYRNATNMFDAEDHTYIKAFFEFGFSGSLQVSTDPIKDKLLQVIDFNNRLMNMLEGNLMVSNMYITGSFASTATEPWLDLYIPSESANLQELYSEFGKSNCSTMEFVFRESLMSKPERISRVSVRWNTNVDDWIKRHIK